MFRVQGLPPPARAQEPEGFRGVVAVSRDGVKGSEFRVQGVGFRVWDLGFRI